MDLAWHEQMYLISLDVSRESSALGSAIHSLALLVNAAHIDEFSYII